MELIFATNNEHKLAEVQALTGNLIKIKGLREIGCTDDIPETGITFAENASLKSRFIYDRYQLNCFGDDSGLEVEALDGAPGVFSARYSGSRDMETNLRLLLQNMDGQQNRKARFRTVLSLIINGEEKLFEGAVEGEISATQSGNTGFGYDPVFKPEGYTITFAEMGSAEKNKISHRAKALQQLVDFLTSRTD